MRTTSLLVVCLGVAGALSACGSSGDDGSATGGTGGESGDGTGGTAGGSGEGGAGAGGGMAYRPPDGQIAGCVNLCALEAEPMCGGVQSNLARCVEDCQVGILFEECSALWAPFFGCVGSADAATCTTSDEPVVADCIEEETAALDCVFDEGIRADLAGLCTAHCNVTTAAMCENGGDFADCYNQCLVIASAFPVCSPEFEGSLTCSAGAGQACDDEGRPAAASCAEENGAFLDCLDEEYAWQPGVGIVR